MIAFIFLVQIKSFKSSSVLITFVILLQTKYDLCNLLDLSHVDVYMMCHTKVSLVVWKSRNMISSEVLQNIEFMRQS